MLTEFLNLMFVKQGISFYMNMSSSGAVFPWLYSNKSF
jgi:hypothetical protein